MLGYRIYEKEKEMKNKILVLTLALITALSSTSAFAAEQVYYTNYNIYDLLKITVSIMNRHIIIMFRRKKLL